MELICSNFPVQIYILSLLNELDFFTKMRRGLLDLLMSAPTNAKEL